MQPAGRVFETPVLDQVIAGHDEGGKPTFLNQSRF